MTHDQPYAEFVERVFDIRRFQARAGVEARMLDNAHFESYMDPIMQRLVLTLTKHVAVDRVAVQDAQVPCHGKLRVDNGRTPRSALVALPRTWWRRLLRRPARSVWCPVVGDAVITGGDGTVPVAGHADVRAEFFHTFPESTIAYPPGLGPFRYLVETSPPEPFWSTS